MIDFAAFVKPNVVKGGTRHVADKKVCMPMYRVYANV